MKFDKIQIELLKLAYNCKLGNKYRYKVEDDKVVVSNGNYLMFIPKLLWFLDTEAVFRNKMPLTLKFDEFMKNNKPITDTLSTVRIVDGRQLHVFKTQDGEEIFIDESILKLFQNDKYDKLHYEGTNRKAPIAVYDDVDRLLGIILPVNFLR